IEGILAAATSRKRGTNVIQRKRSTLTGRGQIKPFPAGCARGLRARINAARTERVNRARPRAAAWGLHSRSQTPVWERTSPKLRFGPLAARGMPGSWGGETEFRGREFPNRGLGTSARREQGKKRSPRVATGGFALLTLSVFIRADPRTQSAYAVRGESAQRTHGSPAHIRQAATPAANGAARLVPYAAGPSTPRFSTSN